jgi:hypothetical protein
MIESIPDLSFLTTYLLAKVLMRIIFWLFFFRGKDGKIQAMIYEE